LKIEASNQSETGLKLLPTDPSAPTAVLPLSNQSTTGSQPVEQGELPATTPAAAVLPLSNHSTTGPDLFVDRTLLPVLTPHPPLPNQSVTGLEPVSLTEENPPTSPHSSSSLSALPSSPNQSVTGSPPVLDEDLILAPPTSPPLDRPSLEIPESPKQVSVLDKAPKPTLGMTSRQLVERPSLYDNPVSPESGPSRKQKPTGRQLVPSRRTRSAASSVSSVSTRSSKRVK